MKKYIGGKKLDQNLSKYGCKKLTDGKPCEVCCANCEYQQDCIEDPEAICGMGEDMKICFYVESYIVENP
jgi:hypothetical protein